MSMDYRVVIHYDVQDNASPKLQEIGKHGNAAGAALELLSAGAGKVAGFFDSIASMAATGAMALAGMAAAAATVGTKMGLDINRNLEDTNIGVGVLCST